MRQQLLAALFAIGALIASTGASAQAGGDQWRFTLTPYLWLPNVDGTLKFSVPPGAGGSPSVGVGPNDYLENLDFALMLAGEARRGDWAIISDLIYLDFAGESSAVKSVSGPGGIVQVDRKSTRLNSSHVTTSRMPSSA